MLLGTDPEFVFIGNEGLVSADIYYPRQNNGRHDNPEIGGDGHPKTVEIRTSPKSSPKEVVGEIKRIFTAHKDDIPREYAWRAGSFCAGKSLGGHIHFGDIRVEDGIITALDGIIGQVVTLLEDTQEAKQRRATEYGKRGDIRVKPWGFEYRTPASWIVSPEISLGVLALAKACVQEELAQDAMCIRYLTGNRLQAVANIDRHSFMSVDKSYFLEKLPVLWDVISRYRYFFTEEGRPLWRNVALLKHIALNYPSWHTEKDLLHRWKVVRRTPSAYLEHFKDKKEKLPPDGILNAEAVVNMLAGQNNDRR